VICVSHQAGAGGRELATAVAERLGYRFVDEEVMAHAAATERVTVEELADVERRKSFFSRLMIDFGHSGTAMYGGAGMPAEVMAGLATPDKLRGAIRTAIEEIAAAGRVVIVSHAASHALSGGHVLRVLVVAPDDVRRGRVAATGEDDKQAAKRLAAEDAGRSDYLKRFYGIDHESPDQYDLVVNTGRIAPTDFVPLVVSAAEL
jgi:cytidylate kinase